MKTKLFGVLASAFLALPVASFANEDISVEIGEITAAHQEKMQAFSKKMQGASREEQRKIYQEEYPDAGPAVAQLTKIVSANPQDAASLDAIAWMLRHSREGLDPAVFEALEKHHLDREELVPVVAGLMRGRSPEAQAFLKTASEKSAQKDVRGMALFARAFLIERDPGRAEEYTALMEKIVKDHQDLEIRGRKVAKQAEGKLFAAKNLAIGKKAPEIVGKDVDGNEMKLSDYLGKVVVIDFWGDW